MTEEQTYEARVKTRAWTRERDKHNKNIKCRIFRKRKCRDFYGYPRIANKQTRKETNKLFEVVMKS
jgi:hypothetical protein